jgi:predicted nucleotidyltransferase
LERQVNSLRQALEKIVNYTVTVANPEKIILFGSLVNGKENLHSDVDLIVVTDSSYQSKELELRISSFAREYAVRADVLIRTPSQIAQAALNPLSFLDSAIKQGQIVYERS